MKRWALPKWDLSKVFLIYKDSAGIERKETVVLRFQDQDEEYFSMEIPFNFVKPKMKKKIQAEIEAYTPYGVFKTAVILKDIQTTLKEVFYVVHTPATWNFVQLRRSSRIETAVPLLIKFDEDFEIAAVSHDLALGGVSFYYDSDVPSIYRKVLGTMTLKLPENEESGFNSSTVQMEYDDDIGLAYSINVRAKFVRGNAKFFAFKFRGLAPADRQVLKKYLLSL